MRAAFFLIGVILWTESLARAGNSALDWSSEARRFTGESEETRSQAVENLKRLPSLVSILRGELEGENRFLAFDVISTLKLSELLPDLIRVSEFDESGFSYHAINGLVRAENQETIASLYLGRLESPRSSSAARVVILDTLARMKRRISVHALSKLMTDDSVELRSSAVHYLRSLRDPNLYSVLDLGLKSAPYQIKLQTLHLLSELPSLIQKRFSSSLKDCQNDSNSEVKNLCSKLLQGLRA